MLILTRRPLETIVIIIPPDLPIPKEGLRIDTTLLGVKGNHCRIGIKADKRVLVHREEIYERIQQEQREAAQRNSPKPPESK